MSKFFDLDNFKLEAAKASEAEKTAIMRYMQRYTEALHGALSGKETAEACDSILSEAVRDPVISVQSFVALCVWAWS